MKNPPISLSSSRLSDLQTAQTLPLTVLNSSNAWQTYLKQNRAVLAPEIYHQSREKRLILLELAKIVVEMGGWKRVTAFNKWPYVDKFLENACVQGARREYETYLLPLEKNKQLEICGYEAKNRKMTLYPPETGVVDEYFWESVSKQDIVVLRGFTNEVWTLNFSLFTVENIQKLHGNDACEVHTQYSEPECEPNTEHPSAVTVTTLASFLQHEYTASSGEICTAVSAVGVNIGGWREWVDELRRILPKSVLFGGGNDALIHCPEHIPGLTLPQIHIRTANSWRGVYFTPIQQIYLNLGPGSTQLYAVDSKSAPKLLKDLKSNLNIDLMKGESRLWLDENYVLMKEVEMEIGEILPGDLVLLKPGVVYWDKSVNNGVICTWGFLPKEIPHFKSVFQYNDHRKPFQIPPLIPIYTTSLRLLQSEMLSTSSDFLHFLTSRLRDRCKLEERLLPSLSLSPTSAPTSEIHCFACKQELFYIYILCFDCKKHAFCPSCSQTHHKNDHFLTAFSIFVKSELMQIAKKMENRHLETHLISTKCEIRDEKEKYAKAGAVQSIWTGSSDYVTFRPQKTLENPHKKPVFSLKRPRLDSNSPVNFPVKQAKSEEEIESDTLEIEIQSDSTFMYREKTKRGCEQYVVTKEDLKKWDR